MKTLAYIKYFLFLWINWDFRIARFIIRQEIAGEKKYGIDTTGADELNDLNKLGIDTSHATLYMPVSYILMEEIFTQLAGKTKKHFLDMGCGRGRPLCIAAQYGFNKVTGLDFSKKLCDKAFENIAKTKHRIPSVSYNVINNDAFYYEVPADVDCIFFFNPFDEIIMSAVVNNINNSLQNNPRKITIIYVNPLHKELFLHSGFKEKWHIKRMDYIEAVILEN